MRSLYIYQALLVLQCPWSINAHPFQSHKKRQDGASQIQPPTIPAATFAAAAAATTPASLVADNLVVALPSANQATVPLETAQMAVTLPSVVATPLAPASIPITASDPVTQTEQAAAWPITELQTTSQQVFTTVQAVQPVQEPTSSTAAVQAPVWAVLPEVSSRVPIFSQAVLDSSVPASTMAAPAAPQASVVPAALSDSGFVLLTQDSLATPTQAASLTPQVLAQEPLSAGALASEGFLNIPMAATTTRFATRPTDGVPTLDAQPLLNMPTVSQTDAATPILTSAAVSEVLDSGSSASIAVAVTTVILATTPESNAQDAATTSSSVPVERVVTVQPSATVPPASQTSDDVPLTPEAVLSVPALKTDGVPSTALSQTQDPEMTRTHTKRSRISEPEPSDLASSLLNSMPQVPAIVTPRTTHNHKHTSTDAMHDTESAHPQASTKPVLGSKSHEPAKTSGLLNNLGTSQLQVGSKSTTPPGPVETTQGVKSLMSSLAEDPVLPSKLVSAKNPAESAVPVVKESGSEMNKSAVPVVVSHLGGFGSTKTHESGQIKPSTATLHSKPGPSDKPGEAAPGASDQVAPAYSGHSVPAVLPGHIGTVKSAPLPAKTNTSKSPGAEPVPKMPPVPATKLSPETHGPASTHGPGTGSAPSKLIVKALMPESSTGPGKGVILTSPVPNKPATDVKPQHSSPPKAATSAPPKSVVKPASQPETQPVVPPVVPTSPSPANKTKDATQAPPAAISSTPPKTIVPVSQNPNHDTQTHTKSPPPASHVMTVPHAKASTESHNTEPSHWLPQTLVRAPTPVESPVTSQAGPVRTGTTNRQKTAPAPAPVSNNLPQAVLPATTLGNTEGMTLGQVTFKNSIPWTFVASTAITQAQLTNFLPSLINQAVSNANAHIRMLAAGAIVVGETSARTVADVWVDAKVAAEVAAAIADGNSAFYNSADMSLLSLSQQVDASFPFLPSKSGKKPGHGSTDKLPPLKVKGKNADNGYTRNVGLADTSGSATQTSEETPSSKPKKAVVLGVAALVSAVSYLGIMFIIMRQVRLRRARRIQLAANSSSGPSRSHLSSLSMPRFGNRNMRGLTISAPIRSENSLGI